MKKENLIELIKYAFVGGTTVLLDILLFTLLYNLTPLGIFLSENLKIPIVLTYNYFAHRIITFKSSENKSTQISKYILANIVVWVFANTILIVLNDLIKDANMAKLIQAILMPIISYTLFKIWVYKK